MIKASIIGAAGLSGQELMRILTHHPQVELVSVTSDKYAGQTVAEVFPGLARCDLTFVTHEDALGGADVAFLAVPNKASLEWAPRLLERGTRVVDLSGVFRLRDLDAFRHYYGLEHTAPDALRDAAFGLPEVLRERIRSARLVANPGCYPTGALLGLLPLGELATELACAPVVDAKSGVSGAGGRVEDETTNFMNVHENFKAYKVLRHQHTPEIEQYLADHTAYNPERQGKVLFTPHLLPIARGILCTMYLQFARPQDREAVYQLYAAFAEREPFVHLLPEGRDAELKMVRGTNNCMISMHPEDGGQRWVVVSAIDNLVKGASGQAVQNMNLMFDVPETAGLI